jgi:hypothetical protein
LHSLAISFLQLFKGEYLRRARQDLFPAQAAIIRIFVQINPIKPPPTFFRRPEWFRLPSAASKLAAKTHPSPRDPSMQIPDQIAPKSRFQIKLGPVSQVSVVSSLIRK